MRSLMLILIALLSACASAPRASCAGGQYGIAYQLWTAEPADWRILWYASRHERDTDLRALQADSGALRIEAIDQPGNAPCAHQEARR